MRLKSISFPLSSPPGIIYFAGHQSKGEPTVANIKILLCIVQRGLEGVRPALLTNLHFRISSFSSHDFLPPLLRSFFVASIESCPHSRRFASSEERLNWLAQMLVSERRRLLVLCTSFVILSLLMLPSDGSSNSTEDLNQSRNKTGHPLEVIRVVFLHRVCSFLITCTLRHLVLDYINWRTGLSWLFCYYLYC